MSNEDVTHCSIYVNISQYVKYFSSVIADLIFTIGQCSKQMRIHSETPQFHLYIYTKHSAFTYSYNVSTSL